MTVKTTTDSSTDKQSDTLLWLAAALVVGIALVWLLISQPWSSGSSSTPVARQVRDALPVTPSATASEAGRTTTDARTSAPGTERPSTGLDDPLRMAELAYEAGMLIEPEDYSAWALFGKALETDPENSGALEGLNKVADDLVRRGTAAIEQGRFDDARETANLIVGVLPEHAGAESLVSRIEELAPAPEARRPIAPSPPPQAEIEQARARAPVSVPAPVIERARPEPAREPEPEPEPEPVIDPIDQMHAAFRQAMVENRLLTPTNNSARYHVQQMLEAEPNHEFARSARELLVTEMLARSTQALEALDTDAARTWVDEAARLSDDPDSVTVARQRLTDALIAMESAKRLPASALTVRTYVAPDYPRYALQRDIEGWVDVEFTVAPDGTTQDITITDGSHNNYFRDEATAAVDQWQFEPRVFMNQPIAQQAYTRLRFVLGTN